MIILPIQFCVKNWQSLVKVIIITSVMLFFIYNVYSNFNLYQQHHAIVETLESDNPPVRFPPVVICPFPHYDPEKLISLGLNVTVDTSEELSYNIDNLIGVNRSLTGGELVEKAAWKVEDMIKEVTIGDFIKESYLEGDTQSLLWHRSFSPVGPCWTFTSPPDASLHSLQLTIRMHNFFLSLASCLPEFEMTEKQKTSQFSLCKNSSKWEKYLIDTFFNIISYLPSTYHSYDFHSTKQEEEIELFYHRHEIYPYEITRDFHGDGHYNSIACIHKGFFEMAYPDAECIPIYHDTLKYSIKTLCITYCETAKSLEFYRLGGREKIHHIESRCRPEEHEHRWRIESIKISKPVEREIRLYLKSNITLIFSEKLLYPLGKLLEDIGGSLGLFLGISVFDLWMYFMKVGRKIFFAILTENMYLDGQWFMQLVTLTGLIFTAVPFCVHCIIALGRYNRNSTITSISVDYDLLYRSSLPQDTLTLEQSLLAFLASRPLGCQVLSLSLEQKSLLQCILQSVPSISLSSLYNEDLPVCKQNYLALPKAKYIIRSDILFSLSESELLSHKRRCKASVISNYTSTVRFSLNTEMEVALLDFFSTIGGIVGLYFGFSMLGTLDIFKNRNPHRETNTHWVCITKLCIIVFIAFICTFLCVNALQKYLLSHPIYTVSSRKPLTINQLPQVTLCMWPPINMTRLLEAAGFVKEANDLKYFDVSKRSSVVSTLIQKLITSQNISNLEPKSLWFQSSWSAIDLHIYVQEENVYKLYNVSDISSNSICNMCQTVNYIQEPLASSYLNSEMSWLLNNEDIYGNTMMNLFFHYKEDFPPLASNIQDVPSNHRILFKRISRWEGINKEYKNSGECLSHCLDEFLIRKLKCRLPWMEVERIQMCNMTEFATFLHSLMTRKARNGSLINFLMDEEYSNQCKIRCQGGIQMYYEVEEKNEILIRPGFAFNVELSKTGSFDFYKFSYEIHATNFEVSKDNDGYGITRLLSDIGGITGMTLGIALLPVLLKILKNVKTF